jgi:hypothetical protein
MTQVTRATGRPRILVAVEPRLLADAMAALLSEADQDDVEVLPEGGVPEGHYDGAVVTIDLTGLDAGVVIRLPDEEGSAGMGTATTRSEDRPVDLPDVRSVLDLLDEHCATGTSRSSVLPES